MRIGLVCGDFITEYSSNERELARGLVELGQEVIVFTSDRKPTRFFEAGEKATNESDEVFGFKIIRQPVLFSFKGFHYIPRLKESIRNADLDIVHTVECYPPHSWHASRASAEADIPLTFTQHQYYVPTGGLGFVFELLDKTKSKNTFSRSEKICAVSSAAKRFLQNHYKVANDRITLTFSPVNTGVFEPDRRRKNRNLTILTVARLTRSKGLNYLIRAFKTVTEGFSDVRLMIIGRGEDHNELVALSTALGVADKISFYTDYVPNEKMPMIYNSSDIFVLPSLIEPVGIAAIEALSCGLPIVATNIGGLSDVVINSENGFLVPPGESRTMADKLSFLVKHEDTRKRFGEASRRRALKEFDHLRVAQKTLSVYEELTERK
jgi:glycosyltransferase involved in cell wall biosynthesis